MDTPVMKKLALNVTALTILLAVLLTLPYFTVRAAAQNRPLPPGEIRANGDITFGNALKLGKREGNKTVITPDTLQILGAGSTGDVRNMVTTGGGALLRSLAERFAERPSVIDFGVDMTGTNDSTAALAAALNSGKSVGAPCGTIRVVSTVTITKQADFRGAGDCTKIVYDAPAGSPANPMINVTTTAKGTILDNFQFDHQANVKGFTMTQGVIAGSALLVQADSTTLRNLTGRNGWDNCIAFTQLDSNGVSVPGKPWYYSAKTIRTFGCGEGPLHAGAGIDVASSRWGTVDDFVDDGSYSGFIQDIGAAANGIFSNMTLMNTRYDGTIESFAMYIGAGDSVYNNIRIDMPQYKGIWLDYFATNVSMNNVTINSPRRDAMWVRSPKATISNLIINNLGFQGPANPRAVEIDTSAGAIDSLHFINPVIRSTIGNAAIGFQQTGANTLAGSIINADITAATTPYSITSPRFAITDAKAVGAAWTAYTPTVTCDSGTLASVSANGASRKVGKTVNLRVNVILTGLGSCTGRIHATIPHAVGTRQSISGVETANTGENLAGQIPENSSELVITRNNGAGSAVANFFLTMSGVYEAK